MLTQGSGPAVAFVWRTQEMTRSVIDMAHQTATRAIFDISSAEANRTASLLEVSGVEDIKISLERFLAPGLRKSLAETGVKTLWLEIHPAILNVSESRIVQRFREVGEVCGCIPILSDPALAFRFANQDPPIGTIAIKGNEASGFVGSETTALLFAMLSPAFQGPDRTRGLFIWGGMATPEAAAAFLCSGAAGVVFESLHWQTDLVRTDARQRERISRLRPEHTTLVGQELGIPCRVFDKGNARAVKELRRFAGTVYAESGPDRRAFAQRVSAGVAHALESDLNRQALVYAGPEAAFAEGFAARFGRSTRHAVEGFIAEITRLCTGAPTLQQRFQENTTARALGTAYPIIQGAMTWISDIPAFALAVAEAGGLPTLALGLKDRAQLDRELGALRELMGRRPYAVNFVSLPENPCRDEQLAWIEENRPPFAVIAAGDPSFASHLRQKGIEVIYVAPSEGLIRMALEAGVRFLVLEGMEAGGHVGEHSTLTLAQIALELKRSEPDTFRDCTLVIAGGIFDQQSAFRAAMLGADAVQLGTAYLATEEIVSTGALNPLYQRLVVESPPGRTAVTGERIGLRVRSLNTPKMDAIQSLEKELAAGNHDEASFRRRLETLSANSLLIAARGVEEPDGRPLDEETCLREGQFMSGAVAGVIDRVCPVAQLHKDLVRGPFEPRMPFLSREGKPAPLPRYRPRPNGNLMAVTGMALVNALGNTPKEIWEAALAMKSGITDVPPSRWDHHVYHDPDPRARGKTYCKVGAFQDLRITRKELGIAPQDFRSMAFSTKLTLWLAEQAIRDSGLLDSGIPRERIGVLISQNSGEAAATVTDLVIDVYTHDIMRSVGHVLPLTPDLEEAAQRSIKSGRLRVDDTTLLGRLNCAASGFICNKYGFTGPAYSVSAACATGLVALYSAIQMIKNGVIDAAVVGGGEELLQPATYLEFAALRALAGLSGVERPPWETSRPFDATRDGMVLGEGGGMIVIEKAPLAEKRGAGIHAYITGMGASNNHQGMVESLAETQKIAIQGSFRDAGYSPDHVDLVACHATSTVQGDVEEVKALKALFDPARAPALTSLKSQIGHTLGASGLNNLVHGVAAMQAGILPATLNYKVPDPNIGLEAAGFKVPTEPQDWPAPPNRPRRLMVNAFGFGGANYVVQLEECPNGAEPVFAALPAGKAPVTEEKPPEQEAPIPSGVAFLSREIAGRPYRFGVPAAHAGEALKILEGLDPVQKNRPLTAKALRAMARRGVFAAPADEPPPPLALVFAGQGSQYVGMSRELYETFPEIRSWMDRIAAVADFDLLDLLFNSAEEDLQKTRWQQPALYTMEYAMVQHLMSLGVRPKAMAGHSLGELVALSVAGVFSFEDGFRIVNKRAECMDKASGMRQDPGTMIAVDGPMELLEAKVAERNNVFFTNFNAPHQVVLGGGTAEVMDLMEDLKREGYRATRLKVSMAFHSPVMRVIHEEMADFVSGIAFHSPGIPVVSNTTMEPFTDDPDQIRRTLMAHLESPVHWMQNVTSLWEDFGVRVFMEIGPRDTLCNLVGDTLGQAVCIPTCMPEREAHTYRSGIARLFALGHLEPDEGALVPSPKALPPSRTPMRPQSPPVDRVAAVVQREINAFLMESFGKFLKPQILEAVRREVDPSFDEDRLDHLFSTGFLADQLPPPAPPASDEAVSAQARPPGVHDYLEELIHIIMDATGYERDEIEPDMDIRQDLAIRSSRLPVIMDAAERHFGISMNMEDYFGLRTVREVADHIAQSAAGGQAVLDSRLPASAPEARGPSAAPETGPPLPLKRLAFQEVRLSDPPGERLVLSPGQKVALIRFQPESELFDKMERWAAQELKSGVLKWDMPKPEDMQGAEALADQIAREPALAGLVFIMDGAPEATLGMQTVPSLLAQCFTILKGFMRAPDKVFCCLLHRPADSPEPAGIAAEGLLGMFLSAAHEYGSVQFRSLVLQDESDFREVMARALDTTLTEVALHHRGHETFCLEAFEVPFSLDADPAPILRAGDVIVISGGGRGITPHMARALAAFRPKLALLGRSPMDPDAAKGILQLDEAATEETLTQWVQRRDPGLQGDDLDEELRRVAAAVEIHRTLQTLNAEGIEAHYYTCDASDPVQVRETLRQVKTRHGRIDGIIHGAGILRDALLQDMTPEDFVSVVRVKVLGALNLFQAAGPDPLRFMLGLSSLSAVQGNPGQVNYCAANRALSAMMRAWDASTDDFAAKALMLPPIEGTGMAHDPELRALLRLKGMEGAYIHVNEMAELFCRELILGRPDQAWVLFARALPRVKTSRIHLEDPTPDSQDRSVAGLAFEPGAFPMVHKVDHVDLGRGELQLTRSFSPDYDLWLQDHRPFKLLRQPFFSGIMAVETFMEAARLLYPHLSVRGVRHVQYKDVLDCPPGVQRETRILCKRKERRGGEVVCSVSFTSADISPSGRRIERWTTNYEGDVILGADPSSLDNWPDFSVAAETFDTPSLLPGDILKAYEGGTALQGRYRVLETIEGTGPGTVKGSMVYPAEEDFAGLDGVRYQYSPYLLESLLHVVAFYALARESNGTWNMIPGGIQELRFARRCRPGERLILEARLRSEDDRGHAWDARALDEAGAPVLQVTGLTMMRFTR